MRKPSDRILLSNIHNSQYILTPLQRQRRLVGSQTTELRSMDLLENPKPPTLHTIRGGQQFSSYDDVTAASLDFLGLVEGLRVHLVLVSL